MGSYPPDGGYSPVMSLQPFFTTDRLDLEGLGRHLEGLVAAARLAAVRTLGRREQARLFEAAHGNRATGLTDFVPAAVAPMREIIHDGRNTLPAFRNFQKRFCRPDDGSSDALWGYNEQALGFATGPGYFVAKPWNDEGVQGVLIDYHDVPPRHPAGWPKVLPNSARLGRFVYDRMRDVMRSVSAHVSVGRAHKDGKWMDAWFVLCRDDRGAGVGSHR